MKKEELIKWIKDNLLTKTNKVNSRKLNKQEYFFNENIDKFNSIIEYTNFLNTDNFSERLYCLLNNYKPKCELESCNNIPNFITFTTGYNKYCCRKCKETPKTNKPKLKPIKHEIEIYTNEQLNIINNYGVENFNKLNKVQKTKLLRYNDINYNNRDKFKETLLEIDENGLTGFEKRANSLKETLSTKTKEDKKEQYEKIVKKKKELNLYSIGQKKAKITLNKKDENGLTIYDKRTIKMKELSLEKYNVEYPNQKHLNNIENFNVEYFQTNFTKNYEIDMIKAMKYYNCSWHTVLKLRIQLKDKDKYYVKNNTSYAETELLKLIPNSYKTKKVIYPKELDIYSEQYKFAIEYNGLMWHSFGKSKHTKFNNSINETFDKNKHLEKTELCEEKDIQLFHIFENEWVDKIKKTIWLSIINNKMNNTNKIYARKCIIKELDNKTSNEFLDLNHLQGKVNSNVKLGLFYNNELVSIMTFGKSRYNKNIEYELLRFCNKINFTVIGGASKLLKYFERNYKPKSLISYANRRWSKGNLYFNLGFEYKGKSSPNYFYFKDNNLESRVKYQKHKLKDILEVFDENLTESENMYNNDFRKIYDSGNLIFVKIY